MAAGTNAIAVFYDDRTYRVRDWDNILELRDKKSVLLVGVQFITSTDPQDLPGTVAHTGHDVTFYSKTPEGMLVREIDFSRGISSLVTTTGGTLHDEDGEVVLGGDNVVIGVGEFFSERAYQEDPPFGAPQILRKTTVSIAAGGMDVMHYAKDFRDDDFDVLQSAALDKSSDITADVVPADGTY